MLALFRVDEITSIKKEILHLTQSLDEFNVVSHLAQQKLNMMLIIILLNHRT
jgi:hypothetical protein